MRNYHRRQKSTTLRVKTEMELMPFLIDKMGGMSRTSVKLLLSRRQVKVNDHVETKYNCPLRSGDTVIVSSGITSEELAHPKLRLLYEDDHLLVVDKKEGLLTMATTQESNETTAYSILKSHLRRANPRAELYTVHRLDRETSGVLLFAKTKTVQQDLQQHWHHAVTQRRYAALVEGTPAKAEDMLVSWLTEHPKSYRVTSSPVNNGGQKAITRYTTLRSNGTYSLLDIELETGRKNQIRVQLADIGHPVVGDKKYGTGTTPMKRIGLHARLLEFTHPVNQKKLRFESPIPREFNTLLTNHTKNNA